jgi:hypothetical protein
MLAAGLSAPASAQLRFAPQIAWGEDMHLAVGARVMLSLGRLVSANPEEGLASKIDFALPFDWDISCKDCTYFEITPGLILPITVKRVGPYVGAGLNIAHTSVATPGADATDTRLGLSLNGGLLVPVGNFTAFGEVRVTAGGSKQTVVTAGLQIGGP